MDCHLGRGLAESDACRIYPGFIHFTGTVVCMHVYETKVYFQDDKTLEWKVLLWITNGVCVFSVFELINSCLRFPIFVYSIPSVFHLNAFSEISKQCCTVNIMQWQMILKVHKNS